MIWLMSFLMCMLFASCILFVLYPDMRPAFIAKRWLSHFHYHRHYID